jgi:hypothetical protein
MGHLLVLEGHQGVLRGLTHMDVRELAKLLEVRADGQEVAQLQR